MAIGIIICVLSAIAAGFVFVFIFNAIPAKWLTDYDEEPDSSLYGKRTDFLHGGIYAALLLAIGFVFLYLKYGLSIHLFITGAVLFMLCLIAQSDIKYMIIPDELLIILAVLSIGCVAEDFILKAHIINSNWYSPVLGAIVGGLAILIMDLFGRLIYKKGAMGGGDIKLMAVCGLIAGFHGVLTVLLLAVITSGLTFGILLVFKKLKSDEYRPFGPFIALALALFLIFKDNIYYFISLYVSLLK